MGYILFPLLVFAIFSGLFSIEKARTGIATPVLAVQQAVAYGRQFVAYSNAVAFYLQQNPAFLGSVPASALSAQGNQFPAAFMALSGNVVSQVGGGTGRIITCYSSLPTGAITEILNATSGDASFGIASGPNWTSYAPGVVATPQALATAVPNGAVVSVVQIGT